jgi:mxaA protein
MSASFVLARAVAVMLTMIVQAHAQVRSVHVQTPRPFGYFIGDVIRLEVDIAVDAPFTIVPGSLPKPRSVNYWLDLRSVAVDDRGTGTNERSYRIALEYQTFYAPLEPRALMIPGFTVTMSDGSARIEAEVPAWPFLMSPMREIRPQPSRPAALLRADVTPPPASAAKAVVVAIGCGVAAPALFGVLAYYYAWWPFSRSRRRPFARARVAMRRALAGDMHGEGYLAGLVALHRAFDAAAGRSVMADDAKSFVVSAPTFGRLEPEIDRFFQASRRAFFGADPAGAMAALPPDALSTIAARLAAAERAAA